MDIDYLLFLQTFRETTGAFLAPFLSWMSKFAVSFWPIAMMCMVYWVFDRKAGKRILAGFGSGLLANGFLKLVFCVYRPWIRDARIEPYGDSKVAATGYSFPSGHTTWATSLFGGIGLWARRRKRLLTACVLFAMMLLTMFSRNYLGVHTPQDVLVGFAATALMMALAARIENWTDEKPSRDLIVMAAGLALCAALAVFYELKPYPLTYLDDGSLLVDPARMKADSYEGLGFISAFVICRYFERRKFQFDEKLAWKDRFIIGVVALIPLYLWGVVCNSYLMAHVSRAFARFVGQAGVVVYTMLLTPWAMSRLRIPETFDGNEGI